MASSAAADSDVSFCVAANTTDHRVRGNTRGASRDEVWQLMSASYPKEFPETSRLLPRKSISAPMVERRAREPVPRKIPAERKKLRKVAIGYLERKLL